MSSRIRKPARTMYGKMRKYLMQSSDVMRLPGGLANPYNSEDIDNDEAVVFAALQTKDRQAVQALMEDYGVDNVVDLLDRLPTRRRRPNWRGRLLRLLRNMEGTRASDPAKKKPRQRRTTIDVVYRYRGE